MRKLLSLLAITGVVGSASTSVVSCKNALPQIGSLVFDDINIKSNVYAKSLDLLNQIYTQVAKFAALGDDAGAVKKIKDDEKIHFDFTYPDGTTGVPNPGVPTQSGAYTVKIKVDDGDAYLASTKGAFVTYTINVTLELNDAVNFHPIVTPEETTGAGAYNAISNEFAVWADNESIKPENVQSYTTDNGVTGITDKVPDAILKAKNILYTLYNSSGTLVKADTTSITPGEKYTIQVLAIKEQYWVQRTTTDKEEPDPNDPSKTIVVEYGGCTVPIEVTFQSSSEI